MCCQDAPLPALSSVIVTSAIVNAHGSCSLQVFWVPVKLRRSLFHIGSQALVGVSEVPLLHYLCCRPATHTCRLNRRLAVFLTTSDIRLVICQLYSRPGPILY
ncbi:hypothetical protein BDV18DRAFT_109980 [Aspergillus unguis]